MASAGGGAATNQFTGPRLELDFTQRITPEEPWPRMKIPPNKRKGTRAGSARGPSGGQMPPRMASQTRSNTAVRSLAMRPGKQRILLVDDHPIVRQGLVERLGRQKNLLQIKDKSELVQQAFHWARGEGPMV